MQTLERSARFIFAPKLSVTPLIRSSAPYCYDMSSHCLAFPGGVRSQYLFLHNIPANCCNAPKRVLNPPPTPFLRCSCSFLGSTPQSHVQITATYTPPCGPGAADPRILGCPRRPAGAPRTALAGHGGVAPLRRSESPRGPPRRCPRGVWGAAPVPGPVPPPLPHDLERCGDGPAYFD